MRADTAKNARQVPCPKCAAAPGLPCRDTLTRRVFAYMVHRERVRLFEARTAA